MSSFVIMALSKFIYTRSLMICSKHLNKQTLLYVLREGLGYYASPSPF